MSGEMLLLSALAGVAVIFALGVLVSKDNFYSALFMSVTLVLVATVYAFFDLQPVFVLIVFIFVGAIGIVTVALAATYRSAPERQFSGLWAVPVAIATVIIAGSIFMARPQPAVPGAIEFDLAQFIPQTEYLLIVVLLVSLVVLLLLSILEIGVGRRS